MMLRQIVYQGFLCILFNIILFQIIQIILIDAIKEFGKKSQSEAGHCETVP